MVPDSFYELNTEQRFAVLMFQDFIATPEQREAAGLKLKALSYPDFLATIYWQTIRDHVITENGGKCASCERGSASEVHHRTYEHHGFEHRYLADLMPVCHISHEILQAKFNNKGPEPILNQIERVKSAGLCAVEWKDILIPWDLRR